jgi:hypothetical protein
MRSPIPSPRPRVMRHSPQKHEGEVSISSSQTTITSSRKSLLPQKTSLSYFGFGSEANIRVVARIRPPSSDVNSSTTVASNKNDGVCVFAVKNDTLQDMQVSFLSPSKSNSVRHSPIQQQQQHPSTSSPAAGTNTVSGLTAIFDSPNNKPLMPSTDACTALGSPSKLFSPSQGTTPLRSNGGGGGHMKIVSSSSLKRQSFIPTPTPSKEIEEKIDKRMASQFQTSHGVVAGDETFYFDAVSITHEDHV